MNKLIKLQDRFILVSDEEIKDSYFLWKDEIHKWHSDAGYGIKTCTNYNEADDSSVVVNWSNVNGKIIVGIPELPSIDFSLLSEEDCKTIGWVDVEKLAEHDWIYNEYGFEVGYNPKRCIDGAIQKPKFINGFIKGFKTAQSLNDTLFTVDDMKKAMFEVYKNGIRNPKEGKESFSEIFNRITQSIQHKEWDVEVEMEDRITIDGHTVVGREPKITNNSIKVLRICG